MTASSAKKSAAITSSISIPHYPLSSPLSKVIALELAGACLRRARLH
jgi:hypothetical protein